MGIVLGNVLFDEIEGRTGYRLTEEDRKLWDQYHNPNADLSGKESSFHVFDIPLCIHFRGEGAKSAILSMFTSEKLIEPKGKFTVHEKK